MTDTTPRLHTSEPGTARRVLFARCWGLGGALWLVAGLLHGEDGWRYDAASVLWLAADVAIAAGLLGLLQLRPHGASRVGAVALFVALAARAAFVGGEVLTLAQGHDDNALIPIASMLTALAMVVYGVVVVRRHLVDGPGRWAPLAVGLFPFLVMFPALGATGGEPSYVLIGLWGIPMALVATTVRARQAR
jgi:hypothetical protein